MKEQLIWTVLPNGRNGSKVQLSVHLTLHLEGATTIGQFPTAANFDPSKLAFELSFNGQAGVKANVVSTPVAGLWKKYFPSDGPVQSYEPKPLQFQQVLTFDSHALYRQITELHAFNAVMAFQPAMKAKDWSANPIIGSMAISQKGVTNPPKNRNGGSPVTGDHQVRMANLMAVEASNAKLQSVLGARKAGKPIQADLEAHVREGVNFLRPFSPGKSIPLPKKPDMDFHDAMSMLSQHPALMRMVGIVFDVEVDAPKTPTGFVSVKVSGLPTSPSANVVYPRTAYELTGEAFRTQARPATAGPSEISAGHLKMDPTQIAIGTMNLSAALLQSVSFADDVFLKALTFILDDTSQPGPELGLFDSDEDDDAMLPVKRSSGISIYKKDYAALSKANDEVSSRIVDSGFRLPLYAEDVLKGWRPDVQHNGKWFSLTRRTLQYQVDTVNLKVDSKNAPITDEGQISASLTSSPDGTTAKIHESVATWTGWSLSVPKPGTSMVDQSLSEGPTPNDPVSKTTGRKASDIDPHYRTSFYAEATKGSLPTLRYGEEYTLRVRAVDLAGNSVSYQASPPADSIQKTLYLRHEPINGPTMHASSATPSRGESPYVLIIRKYDDKGKSEQSMRHILPPVGGFDVAELHGMLDNAQGAPDPSKYKKIFEVEGRPALPEAITSQKVPSLPYLPDPTALTANLRFSSKGFEELPTASTNFYAGVQWPDAAGSKLVVKPGTKLSLSAQGDQMNLVLEPGQAIEMYLSSGPDPKFLPDFDQTHWIETTFKARGTSLSTRMSAYSPAIQKRMERHSSRPQFNVVLQKQPDIQIKRGRQSTPVSTVDAAYKALIEGQNHAISPYRKVKAIFATQRPEPGFAMNALAATKITDTSARIDISGFVHCWSTAEVEYECQFTDLVDNVSESRRTTVSVDRVNKLADQRPVYVNTKPVNAMRVDGSVEFHDTKAHEITVVATTKTRFRDVFPAEWAADKFTTVVKSKVVQVPSSRRPDMAIIEHIMPVYTWSSDTVGANQISRKRGNMVRVYLRRPWFSSGNKERLAVVLPDGFSGTDDDPKSHYATKIGMDPAFKAGPITKPLAAKDFDSYHKVVQGVKVPEIEGTATLVTYAVEFDDELQMWYADIEVKPTINYYTPFLRLVVCRYQEISEDGLNTGPLTAAEITQLQPDRVAIVQKTGARKVKVYYAGMPGNTVRGMNQIVGTLEVKNAPNDPWMVAHHEGNTREYHFFVPFCNGPLGMLGLDPNLYEDAKNSNTQNAILGGSPPEIELPNGGFKYRVVLREYEIHPSLDDRVEADFGHRQDMPQGVTEAGRLVHVDAIEL